MLGHGTTSNWQGSFWETLVLCCLKLVKEAEQSFLRTDDSQSANFSCLICHLCVWDCSFRESSRAEAGSRSRVYSEVMQSLNVNKVWRWQKYSKGFMAHQSWTKRKLEKSCLVWGGSISDWYQTSDSRVWIRNKQHEIMFPSWLVSAAQPGGVMVWEIFPWHILGSLVPTEHCLWPLWPG